jgi:apolipoprotein D and lipocalin family protein
MRLLRLLLPFLALSAASATPSLQTVDHVDLPRYMGRWYVIAHIPNFLEKNKVGSTDNYAQLSDGKLDNTFTFRKGTLDAPEKSWHGTARVIDHNSNAVWKVRLFWPFSSGYRILELDPDYQWAVVSTDTGKLFWVLSRSPALPPELYARIVNRLLLRGLDTARLEKVPQSAP